MFTHLQCALKTIFSDIKLLGFGVIFTSYSCFAKEQIC